MARRKTLRAFFATAPSRHRDCCRNSIHCKSFCKIVSDNGAELGSVLRRQQRPGVQEHFFEGNENMNASIFSVKSWIRLPAVAVAVLLASSLVLDTGNSAFAKGGGGGGTSGGGAGASPGAKAPSPIIIRFIQKTISRAAIRTSTEQSLASTIHTLESHRWDGRFTLNTTPTLTTQTTTPLTTNLTATITCSMPDMIDGSFKSLIRWRHTHTTV